MSAAFQSLTSTFPLSRALLATVGGSVLELEAELR